MQTAEHSITKAQAQAQAQAMAFQGTEGIYMLPHHVREIDRLMRSTTDGVLLVVPLPSQRKTLRVLDSGCADGRSVPLSSYLEFFCFVDICWLVGLLSCSSSMNGSLTFGGCDS